MQPRSVSNIWGIDVSHWQGLIDWQAVAAAGVQFAMVKATDGVGTVDEQFRRNAGGAHAVGIPVGFYHYAHPVNNYLDEVDNFCRAVSGLPVDLPYVLDLEDEKDMKALMSLYNNDRQKVSQVVTIWAVKWLEEVKKRTGKKVMIYTSSSFVNDYFGPELGAYPLWVAHYGVNQPASNYIWKEWSIFQFSQTGSCPGIIGNVNMNVMEASFLSDPKLTNFDDVPAGHWAESVIKTVSDAGIMKGGGDNKFAPDQPLTRAQAAKIVNDLLYMINSK
jgi:lysozyme